MSIWRRRFLSTCLFLIAAASHASAADGTSRPNILLIGVDDMADWIQGMALPGYPTAHAPNLQRLMKRGILFTQAYCASPICGPSRAAVLTGLRPETSKVYTNVGTYVDYVPQATAFPEHLRQNGYHVMGAGKINHAATKVVEKNWDEYGPSTGIVGTPFTHEEMLTTNFKPTSPVVRPGWELTLPLNRIISNDRPKNQYATFDWGPLPVDDQEMPDGRIARWAVEQLARKFDTPFFLGVGFYKPHLPWYVPKRYFDLNPLEGIRLPPSLETDLDDLGATGRDYALLPFTAGTHATVQKHGQWREAVQAYLACISFVDAQLGRILDALDRSEHAANTVIIFWSDHGWLLGEKQHWGKYAPWQRATRVPLIIAPPAGAAPRASGGNGARCDRLVNLLDFYPTLLELCLLPPKPGVDGVSFASLIANPAGGPVRQASVTTLGRGSHSVRHERWHYIRYFDGTEELYDLAADPNEWRNLAVTARYDGVKATCRRFIVTDSGVRCYVRYQNWKAVFHRTGKVELFNLHAHAGISENTDVAAQNPQVVAEIERRLASVQPDRMFVNLDAEPTR